MFLIGFSHSYSQSDKLNQFWNEYAFTADLSQNWVLELDAGLSSSSIPDNPNMFHNITQVYFRAWAHYYPAQRWKLSIFYAYFGNRNVPELSQENTPELRSAVQVTYSLFTQKSFKVNLRGRFEDRHLKNESSNFEAVERFRFQVKAVYPLNFLKVNKIPIYSFASDEVFFKTKSAVSGPDFFDRNRFTVGLGISLNNDIQIEPSYAREVMPRETSDQLVNAFQLNFIFNNFFSNLTKSFKRTKTSVDDGSSGI
ncbi:Protein of unknown function [Flavobacterium phragmitis]|uniref:DUF2490 domain-containing protein n=2 Tax=Flavobacterium phragmitis TaxID=739143 RepID=A0A1I1LY55_9FLAO|nr:Protein of unknown function [Flavobacterium phragmitis]